MALFQKEMRNLAISSESKAREAAATSKQVGCTLIATAAALGVEAALPALLSPRAGASRARARERVFELVELVVVGCGAPRPRASAWVFTGARK